MAERMSREPGGGPSTRCDLSIDIIGYVLNSDKIYLIALAPGRWSEFGPVRLCTSKSRFVFTNHMNFIVHSIVDLYLNIK